MDETIESNDSFPRKILGRGELENRGKQRVAPVKGAVSTKATRGRRVEEESKREGRRMRENTERRESKSPGRALWGWINTTLPRIREGATIHQPPAVVCLSASCTLTTTSILNQTPLLFSFYSRFWQPPASFHGVGACTNPFFGGVGNFEDATN